MDRLIRQAANRGIEYLNNIHDRRVFPLEAEVARVDELGGEFPDKPLDDSHVLELLDLIGSPATVASAGGRYFGFVTGGALPVAIAATILATAWDQNAFSPVASPVGVKLEEISLRWLTSVLELPSESYGALVTGTHQANFCGLLAARHALLMRAGWNAEERGLWDAPALRIVAGKEAHTTLLRAVAYAGFGRANIEVADVDDSGRINLDALPPLDDMTILSIQAGNVNSGAFDPATELCEAARAAGSWVHVDGAFGLWARAAPRRARLAAGFELADSWAVDAHKWLNTPYDAGAILVRDPAHLAAAMSLGAEYLPDAANAPIDLTPEGSRRARGVAIWAALRSLGRSGVAELVDRCCRLASRMAEHLDRAGLEVLNEVVLNQVVVAFGTDEETRRVIEGVQRDGTCWCGGTKWHGRSAMRISVSSWSTTDRDIDQSAQAIIGIAQAIRTGSA